MRSLVFLKKIAHNLSGLPSLYRRPENIYYTNLEAKVVKRIIGWKSRILSFGGRVTLIKHVLESIPIHAMASISPTKTTLNYIKRVIDDFFWGLDKKKKKYHWASWKTLSFPCEEKGIGVRKLEDIGTAMQFKKWWTFRTKTSL